MLQFAFLLIMVCLTAITLDINAINKTLGDLPAIFIVSRFVITGCILVAIWEMAISFQLWKIYDPKTCSCSKVESYGQMSSNKQNHEMNNLNDNAEEHS